jgi:hypothetical protein
MRIQNRRETPNYAKHSIFLISRQREPPRGGHVEKPCPVQRKQRELYLRKLIASVQGLVGLR